MVQSISLVLQLAMATGIFGSAVLPRAVSKPSWVQTEHFIDLGGVATSHVGDREITPAVWMGEIFPGGPNTTITGPSLTTIHNHLVELNPTLLEEPVPAKILSLAEQVTKGCSFGPYQPYDCVSHCASSFISSLYLQNTVFNLLA
jgi:hypothetical protein